MRAQVNPAFAPDDVPAPDDVARAFHEALPGYRPTPVRDLAWLADELGVTAVALKDESDRLGLPAFKVLGASWAIERVLRDRPDTRILVAASAGNHGRAVATEARRRGLRCRVFLPARSAPARRDAIVAEGAEVVVIDGTYEDAVRQAADEAARPHAVEIADVGPPGGPPSDVIDGYGTLFAEAVRQTAFDLLLVPAGVGSLAAAAARFAARAGVEVVVVEPVTAACVTASLAAGMPTTVPTPGTTMAGLDCAEVSAAAWPSLRRGISGTLTVADSETRAAMRELAAHGLEIGDCGAAPLAALRALASEDRCAELRAAIRFGAGTRVLLIATEGVTDPMAYVNVLANRALPG